MRPAILVLVLGLMGHAATAQALDGIPLPDTNACLPGIMAAEREFGLPPKLLHTIGIVESGRADPATGRVVPWPWTIDVGGIGHMYASKAAAIAAVRQLQGSGIVSIDVGCMQINLMHHPDAFASLEEAFDPSANTRYGARFLSALYRETGNWPQAAAAYHSRTPDIGADYEMRVMSLWPLAGRFPDATPGRRNPATARDEDLSHYMPAFAAQVKQMHADAARLATIYAPIGPTPRKLARNAGTGPIRHAAGVAVMADSE
jgi:hypothetical protein